MDFLKKHYEKIVLSVALLALILTALYLALQAGEFGAGVVQPVPKGERVAAVDVSPYANALTALSNPPQWNMASRDLFGRGVLTSGPIEMPTNTFDGGPPVLLLAVKREPFKLLLKAYSWDAGKRAAYNIQLNFRDFRKTFFVPAVGDFVQDRWENTGYKIASFTQKTTNIVTNVGRQDVDISELALQHAGEKPITLVLGREAEEEEPVAVFRCGTDLQDRSVRRGQRFACEGATYIVVDINSRQMIIVDAQSEEKKHVIPLAR
jgi:hypothetical protein